MGRIREESFCTSCAWTGGSVTGMCPECGSSALARVSNGAVVELPAGDRPCEGCASLDLPLIFRGSVRLYSLIWIARESRKAGYRCQSCAEKQTAGSLAFTGLLGWWGIFSLFFYAPRATYHNWRAAWKPPRRPVDWGALDAGALAEELRAAREDRWSTFEPAAAPAHAEDAL